MRARRSSRLLVVVVIAGAALGVTAPTDREQITIRIVWDTPPLKPVFDCSDPEVRRQYPMQCPELGVPPLLGGGGSTPTGGGAGSCGVCDLVRGVLGTVGLGGIL